MMGYRLLMIVIENWLGERDVLIEDGQIHNNYHINFLKAHI